MINQVGLNNAYKYSFVPLRGSGANTPVVQAYSAKSQNEIKKEEEKKIDGLGYKIGAVALIAGLGVFGAGKLLSKRSSFKTNKVVQWLGKQADKLGYKHLRPALRKLFYKSQVIFNVATIKDCFFKFATPKGIDKKITGAFEWLSVRTSRKAYDKTSSALESMFANFDRFNSKLSSGQANTINQKIRNIRTNYAQGFSETARNQRLAQTKKGLSGLFERIWDQIVHPLKFLGKAKQGKFVAEEEAGTAKVQLLDTVSGFKGKITNSPYDKYHTTKGLLDKVDEHIGIKDEKAHTLMEKLRARLDSYRKAIKDIGSADLIPFPQKEVADDLKGLRAHILSSDKYYDVERTQDITKAIQNLADSLHENKKGEIQEIMDIYRNNLSPDDYQVLQKSVNKTMKRFNRAIDLESDKLFDKIRDLNLGSASHDVLAFLLSLGGIGWGISKVDNKDERISVTLKYGIPALFGVAMAIGCTVGLVASGPSLLIGLASTIPINMIGKAIDNARKKNEDEPQANLMPNFKLESPVKMIKDIENNKKKTAV